MSTGSIGKKTVLKIIIEKPEDYVNLESLSHDDEEKALSASRYLVMHMYCKRHDSSNPDHLRLKLSMQKNASLSRLPPCEQSFLQHMKRAWWQTKIWTQAHIANPDIGTPLDHGWKDDGGCLVPVYYKGPMASEILQDLVCSCLGRKKYSRECSCSSQDLPCEGNDCQNPVRSILDLPQDLTSDEEDE